MESTIGLQSGRLEEEKFGFEKGSRIWDGKKWVSKEEWGKDRRINQKTGQFYRGSQTLHNIGNKLVETKDKISSTLSGSPTSNMSFAICSLERFKWYIFFSLVSINSVSSIIFIEICNFVFKNT